MADTVLDVQIPTLLVDASTAQTVKVVDVSKVFVLVATTIALTVMKWGLIVVGLVPTCVALGRLVAVMQTAEVAIAVRKFLLP